MHTHVRAILSISLFAGLLTAAQAASLTWDITDTNDQTINDGAGTWNTSNALWNDVTTDNANVAWNNTANAGDTAVFGAGGAGGTLTVGQAISLTGLTFNDVTVAYTLTGGSLNKTGGVLTITNSPDVTISSPINGTAGLTKGGTGILTLSGNSSYSGNTTLLEGTLRVTSPTSLGTSPLITQTKTTLQLHMDGGGTNALPCALAWGSNNAGTIDVNNDTTGTGGVIQLNGTAQTATGGSTLNVTGGNGYSLYIAKINNTSGNATTPGTMTFNPTTAALVIGTIKGSKHNGAVTDTYTLGGTASVNSVNGVIADSTAGATTLVVKASSSTWTLRGNNTYNGSTAINAGILRITDSNALGTTNGNTTVATAGMLELAGGIASAEPLNLQGVNAAGDADRIVNVSGSNTLSGTFSINTGGICYGFRSDADRLLIAGNIVRGTATSTRTFILHGDGDGEISGVISGAGYTPSVVKDGTGVWTLSGTNTYSGTTTVSNGTLAVGCNLALKAGNALTLSGGTFDAGSFSNSLGALTLTAGSSNTLAMTSGTCRLSFSGLSDSGTLTISGMLGPTTLRFGTSSTALTPAQRAQITMANGRKVGLDANGYVFSIAPGTLIRVL